MEDGGIDISTGQINQILTENKEGFHAEQKQVLAAGLETASYVHTDDTGARHQGKNGYCTVIGNQWFAYLRSSQSKSRQNFLETLQGDNPLYVLNEYARSYLELYGERRQALAETTVFLGGVGNRSKSVVKLPRIVRHPHRESQTLSQRSRFTGWGDGKRGS